MYVRTRMTANPYTITPDSTINDAFGLMQEHSFRRLPVVVNGKVVGIVTEKELQKISPSQATSLSVFELNYLLSKTTVASAMTKNPITVQADALLEEAAVLMRESNVGALPVMEGDRLVGIITETDIFDAFIDLMGFKESGSRITIAAKDIPGAMSEVTKIISSFGMNITHMAVYRGASGTSDMVVRVNTKNTKELEKELEEKGYKIVHSM